MVSRKNVTHVICISFVSIFKFFLFSLLRCVKLQKKRSSRSVRWRSVPERVTGPRRHLCSCPRWTGAAFGRFSLDFLEPIERRPTAAAFFRDGAKGAAGPACSRSPAPFPRKRHVVKCALSASPSHAADRRCRRECAADMRGIPDLRRLELEGTSQSSSSGTQRSHPSTPSAVTEHGRAKAGFQAMLTAAGT